MNTWIALAGVLLVSLVARAAGLGDQMMFDEAASWVFARLPWRSFWDVMWSFEGNMTFYYLLLRAWMSFGESEVALRSLSVILGVGTVAGVYALGAQLFNRRTGLIAAAFLAVHAFHIDYSQEARSYALATFLLVVSTGLFVLALKDRRPLTAAAYVLVSALACYSHLLSILVLMAQWLWFLTQHGFKGLLWRTGTLAGLALTIAPALVYMATQDHGQIDWIAPLTYWRFRAAVITVAGGHIGLAGLYAVLGVLAVYFAFKLRDAGTGLLLFWLAVPAALLVGVSLFAKPMFIDRYLLMSVPALTLLAARGIDRALDEPIALKAGAAALGVLVLGLSAAMAVASFRATHGAPNALRDMTLYVLAKQQTGDTAVIFTAQTLFPFQYYAASSPSMPHVAIPDFAGKPTGEQRVPSGDEVRNALHGHDRVWLLLNHSAIRLVHGAQEGLPGIQQAVDERFALKERRTFDFMEVALYERRP